MTVYAPRLAPATELGSAIVHARQMAPRPSATRIQVWRRRVALLLLACTTFVGAGSSVAQAWPWDVGDNLAAFVTYLCKPMDVQQPSTYQGLDTTMGLNKVEGSTKRATIMPDMSGASTGGNGLERAAAAYGNNELIIHPSYERNGFASLRWTSFGASCGSASGWLTPATNNLKVVFVDFPTMLIMALYSASMDASLMTAIASILLSPLTNAISDSFRPIMFLMVTVGAIAIVFQVRGSLRGILNWAVWVIFILGVYGTLGTSMPLVVSAANGIVTSAGAAMGSAVQQARGIDPSGQNAQQSMNEALWRGVPYTTWLVGQVGPQQAAADADLEAQGSLGWGPVILNGNYIGDDEAGRAVSAAVQQWNSASYSPNGDGTKTNAWTNGDEQTGKIWNRVPFLAAVKWMCNDTTAGGEETDNPANNRWFYGGSCDSAGAGTTEMVPSFTGDHDARTVAIMQGAVSTAAIFLALAFMSIFLLVKKMQFLWLQVVAAIFLAVGAIGTREGRALVKRFGWHVGGNILWQSGAVVMLLFTSHVVTSVFTFTDQTLMPAALRPLAMVMIFLSLLLMLPMMRKIMVGTLTGDTRVVDRVVHAPERVVGTAAKTGAIVGAAVATGGMSAATQGALSTGAMAAGRMLGTQTALGKTALMAGRGMRLRQSAQMLMDQRAAADTAKKQGVQSLLNGPGSDRFNGKDGTPDPKLAQREYEALQKFGQKEGGAQKLVDAKLAAFYQGYERMHGEHHPNDPKNPINMREKMINEAVQRKETNAEVKRRYEEILKTRQEVEDIQVNGPPSSRPMPGTPSPFDPTVPVTHGADLASRAQRNAGGTLTAEQLAQSAVNGMYDHAFMDPRHPATAPLQNLQRKSATIHTDRAGYDAALDDAAAAVGAHGLPTKYSGSMTASDKHVVLESSKDLTGSFAERGMSASAMSDAVYGGTYRNSFMDPAHPATPAMKDVYAAHEAYRANPNQLTLGDLTSAQHAAGQVIEQHGLPARMGPPVELSELARAEHIAGLRDDSPERMFHRRMSIPPVVMKESSSVLASAHLSEQTAMDSPETLLQQGYAGRTVHVDPYHPASEHLIRMNFAQAAGDTDGFATARQAAATTMRTHSVPAMVAGPTSAPVDDFDVSPVLHAMPRLDAKSSWSDRADAAITMQRAYATMPQDHQGAQAMGAYVSALGDPDTPLVDVQALQMHAASVLAPPSRDPWQPPETTDTSGMFGDFEVPFHPDAPPPPPDPGPAPQRRPAEGPAWAGREDSPTMQETESVFAARRSTPEQYAQVDPVDGDPAPAAGLSGPTGSAGSAGSWSRGAGDGQAGHAGWTASGESRPVFASNETPTDQPAQDTGRPPAAPMNYSTAPQNLTGDPQGQPLQNLFERFGSGGEPAASDEQQDSRIVGRDDPQAPQVDVGPRGRRTRLFEQVRVELEEGRRRDDGRDSRDEHGGES